MSASKWTIAGGTVALVAAIALGCTAKSPAPLSPAPPPAVPPSPAAQQVREPAVAGLFYPSDPAELSQMLDGMLAQAKSTEIPGELRALVCPHAGYQFSGPIAANSYRLVPGREFTTVVILAPSHYVGFVGASVAGTDAYRTPLGLVPVSPRAKELARVAPFVLEPKCPIANVVRPQQASRPAPAAGEDTPDTWEHSAEVQVPFLQKVLKNFTILPIITGEVAPEQVARGLERLVDDKTLVVVSTDLSHYHPYDEARTLDRRCVAAICAVDPETMQSQEACGKTPVLALLHLARQKGWQARLIDYRNSGDTTGDKQHVVGYAAVAFFAPAPQQFAAAERQVLLDLSRQTLRAVVTGGPVLDPNPAGLPKKFSESKGCFVTLTEHGALRGCIGNILPQQALYRAVIENTQSSALRDHRFLPVKPAELDQIEIEISVLTVPEPLPFRTPEELLSKLRPHRDGVVLQIGGRGATFLPQVWAQIPDKVEFLNALSQKAGRAPADWRGPDTKVLVYQVESFSESAK